MHGRTIASFFIGFAAGVICLCAALWAVGGLRVGPPSPFHVQAFAGPPVPAPSPADLAARAQNAAPRVPISPPPFNAPAAQPQQSPAASGEADRYAFNTDGPLTMPIQGLNPGTLSDTFNDMRDGHRHEALDIPAPQGTSVHAVVDGTVAKLFNSKQGGITVYEFDDSGTYCYYYAHLDHYAPGLKEGMALHRGDVIGFVGNTGDAAGGPPHLHFAVFKLGPDKKWWQGEAIDPLPLLK